MDFIFDRPAADGVADCDPCGPESEFEVRVVPGGAGPPLSVATNGNMATVGFAPVEPQEWTCVKYMEEEYCVGSLPGNVDGGVETNAQDILVWIDAWNGVGVWPWGAASGVYRLEVLAVLSGHRKRRDHVVVA